MVPYPFACAGDHMQAFWTDVAFFRSLREEHASLALSVSENMFHTTRAGIRHLLQHIEGGPLTKAVSGRASCLDLRRPKMS